MSSIPHLVGMIHLGPLPGSPAFAGSMDAVLGLALDDAAILQEAGFPALMVENYGDVPFYADAAPPETVAALTRAVDSVIMSTGLPTGVNVLRNDALSAVGIAAVTGAAMVRVNVLSGIMYTDQGPIVGRAAEVLRKKAALGAKAEIWADVMVKHATPPPGSDIRQAVADTVHRGGADAIIVSGSGTGSAPDLERLQLAREVCGEGYRIAIGSGADTSNFAALTKFADTVIVGTATKIGNDPNRPVDGERARAIVAAAHRAGLV